METSALTGQFYTQKQYNSGCKRINDPLCKDMAIGICHSAGISCHRNLNQYEIDLITGDIHFPDGAIEVERKMSWDRDEFPPGWREVQYLFRKMKELEGWGDKGEYWLFNALMTRVAIANSSVLVAAARAGRTRPLKRCNIRIDGESATHENDLVVLMDKHTEVGFFDIPDEIRTPVLEKHLRMDLLRRFPIGDIYEYEKELLKDPSYGLEV